MKPKIYVETSFFSFLTAKPSRDILSAAWQSVTAEWWDSQRSKYDLYISELVREEASRGDADAASRRIAALNDLLHLEMSDEVVALARRIVAPGPLPAKAAGDALHLALSTIHKMDFLLTWNCRHLDNAEIKPKVRNLIVSLGYSMPEICTPQELFGEESYGE